MKASNYRATNNEANFGQPIATQVAYGTHLTFEFICHNGTTFFMTRWPNGLPGHDDPPNVLRFPHGLIRVGETLEECAKRIVHAQLGLHVRKVTIAYWDSYLDETKHWHVEPGCIVEVTGKPHIPKGASEIVEFDVHHLPTMTFWTHDDFLAALLDRAPELTR